MFFVSPINESENNEKGKQGFDERYFYLKAKYEPF